jgi:tetratricopeptide (TPR) repeat protein
MPQHLLDDALDQLVRAELIFRRGTPPDAEYTFKHALVQDAAYSTLLRSRRQQLHNRIASTLESRFSEIAATQPQVMAQHWAEAGLAEKAIRYWLKAGQQAVIRSSMTEAVKLLEKGLTLLTTLPASPQRHQQEFDLRIALGPALIATRGYSSPEVGQTFARASALAEQTDQSEYVLPLLYGQWVYHLVRSEHKLALPFAERMEQIGKASNDTAVLLSGHLYHGIVRFFLGEFTAARALFEQCHELRDPSLRQSLSKLTAEDGYSIMLGYLALTLAYLGYFDQARSRVDEGLSEARRLQHVHTLGFSLLFKCWVSTRI